MTDLWQEDLGTSYLRAVEVLKATLSELKIYSIHSEKVPQTKIVSLLSLLSL